MLSIISAGASQVQKDREKQPHSTASPLHSAAQPPGAAAASTARRRPAPKPTQAATWFPSKGSWRRRLFVCLTQPHSVHGAAKFWSMCMVVVVLCSIGDFVAGTLPSLRARDADCGANGAPLSVQACEPHASAGPAAVLLHHTYRITSIIFSIDYVLRLLTVGATGRSVLRYARKPICVIDLVALLPFYADLYATLAVAPTGAGLSDLGALRVLRIAQLLRALRMQKFNYMLKQFTTVVKKSLPALYILLSCRSKTPLTLPITHWPLTLQSPIPHCALPLSTAPSWSWCSPRSSRSQRARTSRWTQTSC